MANDYEISAGIVPIDNSSGATAQSYYVSAGLIPDDLPSVTVPDDTLAATMQLANSGGMIGAVNV